MNRRGPLSKVIGGAVDFTKQYQADQKQRKEAQKREDQTQAGEQGIPQRSPAPEYHQNAPRDDDSNDEDEDGGDWALDLDEAQQCLIDASSNQHEGQQRDQNADADKVLRGFIEQHPPPTSDAGHPIRPLPMPVMLPQRRPESHHRGFVRAYAPVLAECGIDQASWLEFLDGFEKSIKANPCFSVLNAGAMVANVAHSTVAGFSLVAMLVSVAVNATLEASRRTYVHFRQNGYLDTMNEEFFKLRGLYCLVIKYKPSSTEIVEDVDLDHNIAKAVEGRDGQSKWKNAFRSSSTTITNEAQIPEAAPLVFPELDALDDAKKQNAVRQFGESVSKYFDHRAATKFTAQNPGSKIPQAQHEDQSNADSSETSDGLLSKATGGKAVGPVARIQQRRNARREEWGIDRRVGREAMKERKKNRPLKKMMKQDALYLMVVNLPTQAEMDAIAATLGE